MVSQTNTSVGPKDVQLWFVPLRFENFVAGHSGGVGSAIVFVHDDTAFDSTPRFFR